MTSERHRWAIGSLRAVALDAPDIDLLATFYEQLASWRRVPGDDDEWITIDSGDGWRIGLQRATGHVPPHWPDQDRPQQAHLDFRVPDLDAAAERGQQRGASLLRRKRTVAHTGRPGRPPVRPERQRGRSADHPDGPHARLPRCEGAEPLLRGAARQAGDVRGRRGRHDRRGRRRPGGGDGVWPQMGGGSSSERSSGLRRTPTDDPVGASRRRAPATVDPRVER